MPSTVGSSRAVRDNGAMSSSLPTSLAALARGAGQLLRIPTAFLLGWAGLVLVVLGLQLWALLAPPQGPGPVGSAVLLGLLGLLALPVVVLAVRRRRWLRLSGEAAARQPGEIVSPAAGSPRSTEILTIDSLGDRVEDDMRGLEGEQDVRAVMDAFTEVQLPEASRRGAGPRMTRMFGVGRLAVIGRVFGRMERAQRALLTAAGGAAQAPYLRDDLRVTVASFVGTMLTIAVGSLGILVLAAVLLTR